MPQTRFELAHSCLYSDLNAARLPIPPLWLNKHILHLPLLKVNKYFFFVAKWAYFYSLSVLLALEMTTNKI